MDKSIFIQRVEVVNLNAASDYDIHDFTGVRLRRAVDSARWGKGFTPSDKTSAK